MYNIKYAPPNQIYIDGEFLGSFNQVVLHYNTINTSVLKREIFFELQNDSFYFINDDGHHVEPNSTFKIKPYQQLYKDIKNYAPLAKNQTLT